MDRLSPLDASFLFGEDGNSHMDIGMVLEFDGPPASTEEVAEALRARLPLVPRYRQKVRLVPTAAGLPVWIDDVAFDVRRHVFDVSVPAPGDDDAFQRTVSEVMSSQLDRGKPLWEVHRLSGLANGRWALVIRMHHCMVDGVTSTAIVGVLLTDTPEPSAAVVDDWVPDPEPTDVQLFADAVNDNIRATGALARGSVAAALQPLSGFKPPADLSAVDFESLRQLDAAPLDPTLTGPIGPGRRFLRTHFSLDEVRAVRSAFGGTVNDVMLTLAAGAFRALLLHRGELVSGRAVRTLMPVAMKASGSAGANQIGGVPVELPLGQASAVDCHNRIRAQTASLKALGEAMPAPEQIEIQTFGLPTFLTLGLRAAGSLPTLVHTVTSNVPGPQHSLYLNGRELQALSACISLWAPLRIAVQVLSYRGTLSFAVVADARTASDLTSFVAGAEATMQELRSAAVQVAS